MAETSITTYLNQEVTKKNIQETLAERTPQFITSVSSLVNSNKLLQQADRKSLLSACLIAASLDLPINQNLGFAYIIPYWNSKLNCYEAQFQMGWKGFIQLALRSNQYRTINVTSVMEAEIVGKDILTGEMSFNWIQDEKEREEAKPIGYIAHFELLNGFRKSLYMTTEQLENHAKRYSQSYKANKPGMNLWKNDFEVMARKTVLKQLISKYGPMTSEMQRAVIADQSVDKDGTVDYIDNPESDLPDRLDDAQKKSKGLKMGALKSEKGQDADEE